jgi:hypothetical protein
VVLIVHHSRISCEIIRVAVESHSTARGVIEAVSIKLGITSPSSFGLIVRRGNSSIPQCINAFEKVEFYR